MTVELLRIRRRMLHGVSLPGWCGVVLGWRRRSFLLFLGSELLELLLLLLLLLLVQQLFLLTYNLLLVTIEIRISIIDIIETFVF